MCWEKKKVTIVYFNSFCGIKSCWINCTDVTLMRFFFPSLLLGAVFWGLGSIPALWPCAELLEHHFANSRQL